MTPTEESISKAAHSPGPGSFVGIDGGMPARVFEGVSWGSSVGGRFAENRQSQSDSRSSTKLPTPLPDAHLRFGRGGKSAIIRSEQPTTALIAEINGKNSKMLAAIKVSTMNEKSVPVKLLPIARQRQALMHQQTTIQRQLLEVLAAEEVKEHKRILKTPSMNHILERKTAQQRILGLQTRLGTIKKALEKL